MKKLIYLFVFVSFCANAQTPDYKTLSENVLDQLQRKQFQAVFDQMDHAVFTKLDTARLAAIWTNVLKQNGAFKRKIKDETGSQGAFYIQTQLLQFERKKINFRLIWAENKKIKGLYFIPVDERPTYVVPPYNNPAVATEKKILMVTDNFRIPGTLSIPNSPGKHPLVILIHGSGPNDRDETFGPLKIFRDLNSGLNAKGIAVLRYEKRTRLYQSRMNHEVSTYTVKQEVLEDVKRAIEEAKKDSTIDTTRIFLCGHSFGGMLLPRLATENPSVKGLIFMAANGRRLEDLFLAQAEYLANELTDPAKKKMMVDSVKAQSTRVKSLTEKAVNDSAKIFQSPASYWYDLKKYDALSTAKSLNMPMLFMYGMRDYQVTATDVQLWQTALKDRKDAEFKMYPKLNHFFIAGEGKSLPSEYEKPANVDITFITDMATWINSFSK